MLRSIAFFSLTGILASASLAQSVPASDLWANARRAVQDNRHPDAVKSLEELVRRNWSSSLGDKSGALLTEVYLKMGETRKAESLTKRFLEAFPGSAYRDRVEVASATVKILDGNFYEGVEDLLRVQHWTKNPVIASRARQAALKVIASSVLSTGELSGLLELGYGDAETLSWLYMQLGREHQSRGRLKPARYFYAQVVLRYPGTPQAETARQGLDMLNGQPDGPATLLVLAPLSGDFAEFGTEMSQGVSLAFDEFAQVFGPNLQLRIVDDRADPATAVKKVQNYLLQEPVVGIVGPMMSAGATAVGAWLSKAYPDIPMITPTATDDGISKLGPNIFQVNPPTAVLAKSIANYATQCLGLREFAIMSPLSDYGRIMTSEFARTVESNGAQVLALQYYPEGNPDYKTEFKLLRARKFEIDNRRRNMAKGSEKLNSYVNKEKAQWMEDSVITFDAVFIPSADPSDAAAMASHTAFNKLGGQLLGSSGWYGKPLLVDGKRQVENSFFSVPFTEIAEDSTFMAFSKAFEARWGSKPAKDKVSGLSYDATRILLNVLSRSASVSAPQIILQQRDFVGVYGPIRFDSNGMNQSSEILTVQKNRFAIVQGCPTKK